MPEPTILQERVPEAVASASYSLVSKNGFPLILTIRDEDALSMLDVLEGFEVTLKTMGYTPEVKRSFGGQYPKPAEKPVEVVANRVCPKCGNALHYFTTKDGRKCVKCSTQKYDFKTQIRSGCDYTEWGVATTTPTAPVAPRPAVTPVVAPSVIQLGEALPWEANQVVTPPQPTVEPATMAQANVIKNKFPELWHEGMSKREAYSIIQAQFSK